MNKTPDRQEVGANRDILAVDRTVLANERTFAAWIRTGLAALAAGLATDKFMIGVIPVWSHKAIAALFLVFSLAAFLIAAWRYTHVHLRMAHLDVQAIPRPVVLMLSLGLAGCSLIALLVIL